MHGFTDNYIRVEVQTKGLDNTIVPVQLGEWNEKGDALIGKLKKS